VRALLDELGVRFWKGRFLKGYSIERHENSPRSISWIVGKGRPTYRTRPDGGPRWSPQVQVRLVLWDRARRPEFDVEARHRDQTARGGPVPASQPELGGAIQAAIHTFISDGIWKSVP
jgi:hypothetical protein